MTTGEGATERRRVLRAHSASYPVPMRALAGERLRIVKRDAEYPAWIWCISSDGTSAWVPEAVVRITGESGILVSDYDSTELNVEVGDEVAVLHEESGWLWCLDKTGREGWIPAECVVGDA